MTDEEIRLFLAAKKEAGKLIDPETAEVTWSYEQEADPYGLGGLPPEADCVGRSYFVRNPDGEWVFAGDLPAETRERLRMRFAALVGKPADLLPF